MIEKINENPKSEDLKAEFFNDMQKLNQDKAVCLRCRGQMYKLPAEMKSGIGVTIETYACIQCGKIENFFNPEMLKTFIGVKDNG